MSRQVTHDGFGSLLVRFGFDRRLVDLVKTLSSRRWNPTEKYWQVPEAEILSVVELLHPEGFGFDETTCTLYRARGGALPLDGERYPARPMGPGLFDAEPETLRTTGGDYTVSRLNEQVQAALSSAFPAPIWLVGEICGFNKSRHKRTATFHLVEREEDGRSTAEVNATLFESTRQEIERRLAAMGDPFRLEDEVVVRVRARVELYVPWGSYRVVVDELDLNYTLGESARRREEIVRRLTREGLVGLNTALPFPALPLRVGLVTSIGSDASNDVLRTFQESRFAFEVTVHGARVQGRQTEPSILNALGWFREHAREFDVVLVCRGGGSRTDLAWLDSEALGRAVATFPLPVVVGIGHEQDQSVLDAVGWRSKTPTAAAAFLVERVLGALEGIERCVGAILELGSHRIAEERRDAAERARRLVRAARTLLQRESFELGHRSRRTGHGTKALLVAISTQLSRSSSAIPRSAGLLVSRQAVLLDRVVRQLGYAARRDLRAAGRRVRELGSLVGPRGLGRFRLEGERTEARARRLHLVDPRRVVERGYALLRSPGGGVITEARQAPAGTPLQAELRLGTLRLRSEGADGDGTS